MIEQELNERINQIEQELFKHYKKVKLKHKLFVLQVLYEDTRYRYNTSLLNSPEESKLLSEMNYLSTKISLIDYNNKI